MILLIKNTRIRKTKKTNKSDLKPISPHTISKTLFYQKKLDTYHLGFYLCATIKVLTAEVA